MEPWQMFALFGAAFGVFYAVAAATNRRKPATLDLPEGSLLRLVAPSGTYRTRLVNVTSRGIIVSAPLQHSSYVPLHPGEKIIVQAPMPEGIITFRCEVANRSADEHEIVLTRPERVRKHDRRSEPRFTIWEDKPVKVNRGEGALVDLSAGGAKVFTMEVVRPGDFLSLFLPEGFGEVSGWALEAIPASRHGRKGSELRIQFDNPLNGLSIRARA
jgi:hypothetical protein